MLNELEKTAGRYQKPESSDNLQLLAKRAASLFVGKESDSLNSAVSHIINTEDLNKDQIRRVSEMANQEAWKASFSSGNGDRHTSFEPADADSILESLEESPSVYHSPNLDYFTDPGEQKSDDINLEEIFKTESSEEIPSLNPAAQEAESHEKAASVADLARYSLDSLTIALGEVSEEFYGHVKVAHLTNDFGILQIAKAISGAVESEKFAASVMRSASDRLKEEGVNIKIASELKKLSEPVVVNTEHPLLRAAAKLEKLGQAYRKAKKMHENAKKDIILSKKTLLDKLRE